MGVSMSSKHILPFNKGVQVVWGIAYRNDLSDEGKLKLHAYHLHKDQHISIPNISKVLNIDRSTVYRWIKQVKIALRCRRYQYLETRSTRPKTAPRTKVITHKIGEYILHIRDTYKCGKENISEYLKLDYGIHISPSTIGRYLKKLPRSQDPRYMGRTKAVVVHKRNKDIVRIKDVVDILEHRAFERFQIDTKYWVCKTRTFYVITAIDVITRMIFAYAYSRHTAYCARDFLRKLNYLFDISDSNAYIQKDNGGEFLAEFEEEAKLYGITLVTNYIRMPKMNGYIERFNRTLEEELLNYNQVSTTKEANALLHEYVIKYNFLRLHGSIGKMSPFEKYSELLFKQPITTINLDLPNLSHMLWTSTKS